jgi:hypothetical protein
MPVERAIGSDLSPVLIEAARARSKELPAGAGLAESALLSCQE